jgi:hypothetical protein
MLQALWVFPELGSNATPPIIIPIGQHDNEVFPRHPYMGLKVVDIKGIGPPNALINTHDGARTPGGRLSHSKIEKRNINITFVIEDLETGDTDIGRHLLNLYFAPGVKIELGFWGSNRSLAIDGVVESNEVNLFSRNENVEISIICPQPFFRSTQQEEHVINPSHLPDTPLPRYDGEQPTGGIFRFGFLGPSDGDIFLNSSLRVGEYMHLDNSIIKSIIGRKIRKDDRIRIVTTVGEKEITFIPLSGSIKNLLAAVTEDSTWTLLYPGPNTITYSIQDPEAEAELVLIYRVLYSGV